MGPSAGASSKWGALMRGYVAMSWWPFSPSALTARAVRLAPAWSGGAILSPFAAGVSERRGREAGSRLREQVPLHEVAAGFEDGISLLGRLHSLGDDLHP